MESGGTSINILFVILIGFFLVLNIYIKKRRTDKTSLGMVVGIFTDVNKNLQKIENFGFHWQVGKFKADSWSRGKDKIDFLPLELRQKLSRVFDMVEDMNRRIEAAKKYKSDSYMAGVDAGKLKEPLTESKQQLQEWLQENMQNPEYAPKRRGLFG